MTMLGLPWNACIHTHPTIISLLLILITGFYQGDFIQFKYQLRLVAALVRLQDMHCMHDFEVT